MRDSLALRDAHEENSKIQQMLTALLENAGIEGTAKDDLHRMRPTVRIGTEVLKHGCDHNPEAFTITIEDGGIAHHPVLVRDTVAKALEQVPELAEMAKKIGDRPHEKTVEEDRNTHPFAESVPGRHAIKISFPMGKGKADELITALAKRAESQGYTYEPPKNIAAYEKPSNEAAIGIAKAAIAKVLAQYGGAA